MDNNILIKYDIEGEFIENHFYNLDFEYEKSTNIISLENVHTNSELFLREVNGRKIPMQFKGISKVDGFKLFVLNSSNIRRDYKLNDLLQ
jgi:hypothetical protein